MQHQSVLADGVVVVVAHEALDVSAEEPYVPTADRYAIFREALKRLAALKPPLSGEIQRVVEAQGTNLVINRWALAGTDPAGTPVELAGTSTDVLGRPARWSLGDPGRRSAGGSA
jgi:hypothetical protein